MATPAILLVGDGKSGMAGCEKSCKRGCVGNDLHVGGSETDIFDSEPFSALPSLRWRVGVLSNPKQVIKGNVGEVANCLDSWVRAGKA